MRRSTKGKRMTSLLSLLVVAFFCDKPISTANGIIITVASVSFLVFGLWALHDYVKENES